MNVLAEPALVQRALDHITHFLDIRLQHTLGAAPNGIDLVFFAESPPVIVARSRTPDRRTKRHSFDNDWLFDLGDVGEPAKSYNDAAWRKLDLPHDWSIELPRSKDNPTGAAGGYVREGAAWYRKHFQAPRVHVAHWGLAVTTPEVAATAAVVEARTTVENRTDANRAVVVRWRAIGPSGKTVAKGESKGKARAGAATQFRQRLAVRAPKLWRKGRVLFFAHAMGALYHAHGARLHRDVFLNGLKRIHRHPLVSTVMPSCGRINLVHQPAKRRYVAHPQTKFWNMLPASGRFQPVVNSHLRMD